MGKNFFIRNSLPQRRSLGYQMKPGKQARVVSFSYGPLQPAGPGDVYPAESLTGTVGDLNYKPADGRIGIAMHVFTSM